MRVLSQRPEELRLKELTSVEISVVLNVLRVSAEAEATCVAGDRDDEGDGAVSFDGEGFRGIGIGELGPLELDGENKGKVDETEMSVAVESKVV